MCECAKTRDLIAGWGCHRCRVYNGLQRMTCRQCGERRCTPLAPDRDTGEKFETYEEAYADDPGTLASIKLALANATE